MIAVWLKRIFALLLIMLLGLGSSIGSSMATSSGFTTEELTPEEYLALSEQLVFTPTHTETTKRRFNSFDVGKNGSYILGFESDLVHDKEVIAIYNKDGEFDHELVFQTTGTFDLAWDGDDILVYFTRSSLVARIDQQGALLGAKRILNTGDNNSHWNHTLRSGRRIVGEDTYIAQGFPGAGNSAQWGSYYRLVKVLPDGTEVELYYSGRPIPLYIPLGAAFFFLVAAIIVLKIRKGHIDPQCNVPQ